MVRKKKKKRENPPVCSWTELRILTTATLGSSPSLMWFRIANRRSRLTSNLLPTLKRPAVKNKRVIGCRVPDIPHKKTYSFLNDMQNTLMSTVQRINENSSKQLMWLFPLHISTSKFFSSLVFKLKKLQGTTANLSPWLHAALQEAHSDCCSALTSQC